MTTTCAKLPTRTYELRDDPLKRLWMFIVLVPGMWIAWRSGELGLQLGVGMFGLCGLAMLMRPSRSVRATPQGLWLRRTWGLLHVPWVAVAEIGVHEFTLHQTRQSYLRVRLKDGSAHLVRQSWFGGLASTLGWPAAKEITVATIGTEPAEIAGALNDLYEEYVREGLLPTPATALTAARVTPL